MSIHYVHFFFWKTYFEPQNMVPMAWVQESQNVLKAQTGGSTLPDITPTGL